GLLLATLTLAIAPVSATVYSQTGSKDDGCGQTFYSYMLIQTGSDSPYPPFWTQNYATYPSSVGGWCSFFWGSASLTAAHIKISNDQGQYNDHWCNSYGDGQCWITGAALINSDGSTVSPGAMNTWYHLHVE